MYTPERTRQYLTETIYTRMKEHYSSLNSKKTIREGDIKSKVCKQKTKTKKKNQVFKSQGFSKALKTL